MLTQAGRGRWRSRCRIWRRCGRPSPPLVSSWVIGSRRRRPLWGDLPDRQTSLPSVRVCRRCRRARRCLWSIARSAACAGLVAAGPGSYLDELLRLAGGKTSFQIWVRATPRWPKRSSSASRRSFWTPSTPIQPVPRRVKRDWSALKKTLAAIRAGRVHIPGQSDVCHAGPG